MQKPDRLITVRISLATLSALVLLVGCASPGVRAPDSPVPALDPDAPGIMILAHGSGASPDGWPAELEEALRLLPIENWQFIRVDWSETAEQRLAAPRNGSAIGRLIGQEIATGPPRVLHLVGHSSGAFLVQGIVDGIRDSGDIETVIHASFLDPFLARSAFQPRWGQARFGLGADFAESYYTAEDRVPFTNHPLEHAWNLQLDATVPTIPDPPPDWDHGWPLTWYREAVCGCSVSNPVPGVPLLYPAGAGDPLQQARQTLHRLSEAFPAGELVIAAAEPGLPR